MKRPTALPSCCRWFWPAAVLLCGACHTRAEELPPPRVLTAAEWAGVQAAHDDPWPAVRRAAEAMMQRGLGGEYGDWHLRIGTRSSSDRPHLNVPVTISDPAALPAWAKATPDDPIAGPPLAETLEGKWARMKQVTDGNYFATTPKRQLNIVNDAPLAAEMLEHDDLELVKEALEVLAKVNAGDFAPRIAVLAFHRDEDVARHAVYALGKIGAKDQADMLATLADTRPALRSQIMENLVALNDQRAVPIALEKLKAGETYAALDVLEKLGGPEHGPALAALLSSETESVQWTAIKALVAVKARDQATAIAALLEPRHPRNIRELAVQALGTLDAREHAGRIAALMGDGDMAWWCIEALEKLRAKEHAAAIREAMRKATYDPQKGSPEALQVRGVRALHWMGAMTRLEAVREVETILEQTDLFGMKQGLYLLIELGAVESIEAMLRLKGDPPKYDSWLYRNYHPPDALTALGFHARCQEIAWFLQSTEEAVVLGALHALRDFGAREFAPEIAALLARDEPEPVRRWAVEVLRHFGAKESAPAVAALLGAGESLEVRQGALAALADLGAAKYADEIAALVTPDEPHELRTQAIKMLVELKAIKHAGRLAELTTLNIPRDERVEALNALLSLDLNLGLERLNVMMRPFDDEPLCLDVLQMLWSKGMPETAPPVAVLLGTDNERLEIAALNALRKTGSDGQTEQVLPLLRHANESIRRQAAEVLCVLGPRGRSRLFSEANDPALRGMAMKALMEHNEGSAEKLTTGREVAGDALVERAVYWARIREAGVADTLAESLLDEHATVRAASLAAFLSERVEAQGSMIVTI